VHGIIPHMVAVNGFPYFLLLPMIRVETLMGLSHPLLLAGTPMDNRF